MKFGDKSRRYGAVALLVVLELAFVGVVLSLCLRARPPGAQYAEEETPGLDLPRAGRMVTNQFRNLVFPTDQGLDRNDPDVFQPTASGRPESALFGSVRTTRRGKGLAASFHEGVDIAAGQRDDAGRPQDAVYAVADGAVAYVNTIAGNSNYGKYAVLIHACPSGVVYTLYAHLAAISPGVGLGRAVQAGNVLGVVGHTANPPIPLAQAHLHFEVGLIMNARFNQWFHAHKFKNGHGNYNGWNLLAVNPLAVFESQHQQPAFDFFQYIAAQPAAFEIVLAARRKPDFFDRYPCFWEGEKYRGAGLQMAVSEDGLPLRGRNATESERQLLGTRKNAVLRVDPAALGRNGSHLVVCRNGLWRLGREGEKWCDMLMY
ncbi:MAG: M23 family metallopeptidase [Kiritimatiellae bacterium]|nr:M23 family metallopeptidase [Kiritimatiellia bacterium]